MPTGSLAKAKTMGMIDVTCFAVSAASPDVCNRDGIAPFPSSTGVGYAWHRPGDRIGGQSPAALHESACGTNRQFAAMQYFVRY